MKKRPPSRQPSGDTSPAWFVIPMSIAAAVLIAMGDQPMDLPFPPSTRAAPASAPVVPAVHQPAQPRGEGVEHAKVS